MSELPEPSRTFSLEREHVLGLTSLDEDEKEEAYLDLPEALSREEVQHIGTQVNLSTGPGKEAMKLGRKLEEEVLFNVANYLLCLRADIVSARNATIELRGMSVNGFLGYLVLSHAIRQKKKQIIQAITDPESYKD